MEFLLFLLSVVFLIFSITYSSIIIKMYNDGAKNDTNKSYKKFAIIMLIISIVLSLVSGVWAYKHGGDAVNRAASARVYAASLRRPAAAAPAAASAAPAGS